MTRRRPPGNRTDRRLRAASLRAASLRAIGGKWVGPAQVAIYRHVFKHPKITKRDLTSRAMVEGLPKTIPPPRARSWRQAQFLIRRCLFAGLLAPEHPIAGRTIYLHDSYVPVIQPGWHPDLDVAIEVALLILAGRRG